MILTTLRWIGNVSLLVGHFIMLYVSFFWGLTLCFVSNLGVLPFFLRAKMWDVVILMTFFLVIEGAKLASMLWT